MDVVIIVVEEDQDLVLATETEEAIEILSAEEIEADSSYAVGIV